MKKSVLTALTVCLVFALCSCGKTLAPKDLNGRIYSKYSELKSYRAQVQITAFSNKTRNTYDAVQYYMFPDKARTESGEMVTVTNGKTAVMTSPDGNNPIQISGMTDIGRDFMFLNTFFDAYYNGDSSEAVLSKEDSEQVMLSVQTGLENPYRKTAELTLDKKTLSPVFLELKTDGEVSLHIDYIDFEFNSEPDGKLFEIGIKEALKCTNILIEHGQKSTLTQYVTI